MSIRNFFPIKQTGVALIFMGATFLVSCQEKKVVEPLDKEALITMQSVNLTVRNSVNGRLSRIMDTPLLERHEQAKEPFMEFRKGVKVSSYDQDSSRTDIVADYAKFLEIKQLWEARGNVVVTTSKGQVLRTEQLFYDQISERIYSNVHTELTDGEDVHTGNSFESNTTFDRYHIREVVGSVAVKTEPNRDTTHLAAPDSLSVEAPETP